ncbi:uncharacterized protein LOC108336846 [Vigna angularis]|uniref:uncharacterized protein LOC108336846 n=1 Tax=Phaseolus angularis TaxID=3914 RepID=UPI00080A3674|nr:uncharacterized protein LOC108336846 [Vigna angularis]
MTVDELQDRATKFIRIEEMRAVKKRQHKHNTSVLSQEKKEDVHPKRTEKGRKFKDCPKGPRFERYTQLNAPRARILEEALSADLLPPLKPIRPSKNADGTKHCTYHLNIGHTIEECTILRDKVEELVRAGHLRRFVKSDRVERSPPRRGKSQPTYRRDDRHLDHRRSRSRSHDRPQHGVINTISRGFAGGGPSALARKKSLRELKNVHRVGVKKCLVPPIMFTNEDFHAPDPEQDDPMVITVVIARYKIGKVLIDQGSSGHQVVVRIDHPIAKILRKLDLAGRIIGWSVELFEFGLRFESRGSVRGQHLTDFAAELPLKEEPSQPWKLFVDDSSDRT